MNKGLLALFFTVASLGCLFAQGPVKGIHYQAIARDAYGRPMPGMLLQVQASLGSEAGKNAEAYVETHEAQTDARGLFSIVIGEGTQAKGGLTDVPWGKEQVWLGVAIRSLEEPAFRIISKARLLATPYAMHAALTSRLTVSKKAEEKNQSIYWTTSGNSFTSPPTHFLGTRDNQDLLIKTGNVTRSIITKSGQMRVVATVSGADDNINAYPLIIRGSNQGIYIKVNGSRTGDNNFVTFGDDRQFSWGAIEGQTFPELEAYWAYQLQITGYIFNGVALGGSIAAFILGAAGAGASIKPASVAGYVLDAAALAIDLANLLANSITNGINLRRDIGVTYSTGNADYAEWLERMPGERDLYPGEVVGLKAGKISLNTQGADHLRIISKNPGALGNRPPSEDLSKYEKVAFLGQVPVQVLGPVSARDFILPSGNHDGFAIAVHPQDMRIGDYARILGVAWESGLDGAPFNLINAAVGINANYLSAHIEALEKKVDGVTAFLKGEQQTVLASGIQPPGQLNGFTTAPALPSAMQKGFSDEQYDLILDSNEALIREIFAEARTNLIRAGYDLNEVPHLAEFIDNPLPTMKKLRRDPAFLGQWAHIDHSIIQKIKE